MLTPRELAEAKAAALKLRASGVVKVSSQPVKEYKATRTKQGAADYYKQRRDNFFKQGLTCAGKPRVGRYKIRNELALFKHDAKLYHRAHMRLWRGQPITDLLKLV